MSTSPLKTLTFAAAALAFGLSTASAQNATTQTPQNASPNSINKSNEANVNSGSESKATATAKSGKGAANAHMTGSGKFCVETTPGSWDCKFASMAACEKEGKPNNRQCHPRSATTGAR